MAKNTKQLKRNIFIYRDITHALENSEEQQNAWMDENHPDKIVIGGEASDDVIINEEGDSLMCMEYVEYTE